MVIVFAGNTWSGCYVKSSGGWSSFQ